MKKQEKAIHKNYSQKDLGANILSALERAGKELSAQTDTSSFDEFHIRGRKATIETAELAGFSEGMKVLDLGSGLGGPARTLAAEYGCRVTGIDLVDEYCAAARMLTARLGLSGTVEFRQGDMTDLPFEDGIFDGAWTIHTQMNIEDKAQLFNEVSRVLKSNGVFAVYEICAGTCSPVYFPVPWAEDDSISFLISPDDLRQMIQNAGFDEDKWRDVTALSREWFETQLESLSSRPKDAPPPLGLNLLMGQSTMKRLGNVLRNLQEERIKVVQGVFRLTQ